MRFVILAVATIVLAQPAAAQWTVGGGYGGMHNGTTSGPAWHTQVEIPITEPRSPGLPRRVVYLIGQRASTSGAPMTCEQVAEQYCFGRADRSTLVGAGLALAVSLAEGRVRPYTRAGGGVYYQWLASTEQQGAAPLCFEGKEVFSCRDAPPQKSFTKSRAYVGPGLSGAMGARFRVLGTNGFAEVGAHLTAFRGHTAGSLPIAFGLSL